MLPLKEIYNDFFELQLLHQYAEEPFNLLALKIFKYQLTHNDIYRRYVKSLKIDEKTIEHYTQIPFLPIELFKSQKIVCSNTTENTVCFSSSGTTGQITSKHYVTDTSLYEASFKKGFELAYGNIADYCVLALLPNYLERKGSSLVYMFNQLIHDSNNSLSGFYLNNLSDLIATIEILKKKKQKTLLLGVTYALLDLAEMNIKLSDDFLVMETGGMKGKKKEMLKEELYEILKQKFKVSTIHSEYGMTELLSQAYSTQNGQFTCPPWMKILIRDINDPFSYVSENKSGGVNVIDLANINSCSFIETKDIGKLIHSSQFEILGRFDNSDLRGCNLMIQ